MKIPIILVLFLFWYYFEFAYSQSYNAIFSFGDSMSDTGNLCVNGNPSSITMAQPPYGETFFGKPTCRSSNGRLVIDFLAEAFSLPLLPPSKASGSDFGKGANMAIIGATASDSSFLQSIGLGSKIWNNGPFDTQIQWFQQLMPTFCTSSQDCQDYLSKSLFVVGELGGNDYNAALFAGWSPDKTSTYTPQVVQYIYNGVEKLIGLGAVDIVVPGVLPIGCFPIYLTIFQSSNQGDYDQIGCLKKFNDLSSYHNKLLKQALSKLQSKYSSTRIMYGDYYDQVYQMVQSPQSFGLTYSLKVCCGASGQSSYNYNNDARCGMSGASACPDPQDYLSWDGIHLTETAYQSIANGWLKGPYSNPAILH
ncbi:GDSL esterase/lipase At5g45910-like isoform X2 [Ananas comosus]|uniref:GDSL esterase/lipase n=1 Tax=Ananas comosus TaxID=4615 RepID=A0A199USZ3_ANACO|nr:GDSL esterase/lipase At5g45910-like isoform X2 [Ananas comosus]OAY67918.1 GDSL esterase/lipase [Ananas comosus]